MAKNYWMITVRPDEFALIRGNGFRYHSMRASHKRKVQRIEPGDQILFYILERQYFGATAVVNSRNFTDGEGNKKKGTEEVWDFVIHLDPRTILGERQLMDARQMAFRLGYVRKWPPEDWNVAFAKTNLHLLPRLDFEFLEGEMRSVKDPRERYRRSRPAIVQKRRRAGPKIPKMVDMQEVQSETQDTSDQLPQMGQPDEQNASVP